MPETLLVNDRGEWLSYDACNTELGYNLWREQRIILAILGRQAEPPYTVQFNQAAVVQHWQNRLDENERSASPSLMTSMITGALASLARRPADWILRKNLAHLLEASGQLPLALSACWQVS